MATNSIPCESDNVSGLLFDLDRLDEPDLDWLDLVPSPNSPIDLNNITPSSFQNEAYLEIRTLENEFKEKHPIPTKTSLDVETGTLSSIQNVKTYLKQECQSQNRLQLSTKINLKNKETKNNYKYRKLNRKYSSNLINHSYSDYVLNSNSVVNAISNPKNLNSSDWQKGFLNNEDLTNGKPGQRLFLSLEERKMLCEMGCTLPNRFPLDRDQERTLRTIRRKIRNKHSAQASRTKRQHYVIDLEQRYKLCNQENQQLHEEVSYLKNDKRDLTTHIRKLRSYINNLINKRSPNRCSSVSDRDNILPLFASSNKKRSKLPSTGQAAAGGTSLLAVTFVILIWTTIIPLPKVNILFRNHKQMAFENVFNQTKFPGQTRILMASIFDDSKSNSLESIDPILFQRNEENSDQFINVPDSI